MRLTPQVATDLQPHLTQNRLFALLRPDALASLEPHAVIRPFSAGEVIYGAGSPVTHAVFPLSGVISFLGRRDDGRMIEKGNVGPEGFVGVAAMLDGGTMYGECTVTIAGHAAWLPLPVFDAAIERFICVRRMLLRYGKARIEQLHELILCNGVHLAEQRVARWLLDAFDKVHGAPFELKQELLAELLGLRRATVSGICNDLRSAGIVGYSRGHVEILDRARLEARACACYAHIRQRFSYPPLLRPA